MELSPADPNVRYFLLYPDTWWDPGPSLGTSGAITRAAAADLVAQPTTIATAEVSGFDWSYDAAGEGTGGATIVVEPGVFQFYLLNGLGLVCDGNPTLNCVGVAFFATASYAGGGSNTPLDTDGGVNAWVVEVTASDASSFATDDSLQFTIGCGASSDGGQSVGVGTVAVSLGEPYGTYTPLQDVLTRLKVWRMPTRIWPVEPSNFWTNFIGSREII